MPKYGPIPQLCPHAVEGVNNCRECKNVAARKRLAVPANRKKHNETVRLGLAAKRATPEGREAHNAYMRQYNAGGVREEVVEEYLVSGVKERGGLCLKFTSPGRRGAPDRIVCLPGKPAFFVEVKRPRGGKLGSHQIRYHDDLRAVGQLIFVLWTKEDVDGFFATI
jgi:hypothetical protein